MAHLRSDERLHRHPPRGARRARSSTSCTPATSSRARSSSALRRVGGRRRGRADARPLRGRVEPPERRPDAPRVPLAALPPGLRRIVWQYFVADFSPVSLFLLAGIPLVAFGMGFGLYHWIESYRLNTLASTGTVMVATLPMIARLSAPAPGAGAGRPEHPATASARATARSPAPDSCHFHLVEPALSGRSPR